MKTALFQTLLKSTSTLTPSQRDRLRQHLKTEQSAQASKRALTGHEPKICPHCQKKTLVRNGVQNELQRFVCRTCNRSSCATTATPLNRLRHKNQLAEYAECLKKGLTLRQTAEAMKISVTRAFRWRHSFLSNSVNHQPKAIFGVLEIDETYFRRSKKGERLRGRGRRRGEAETPGSGRRATEWAPVLVGRARGRPHVIDRLLLDMTAQEVDATLLDAIDCKNTVLCADGHAVFSGIGERLGVRCDHFSQRKPGPKRIHVQSVNSYHERLKSWINHDLRGVATKYLPNYLAWHRLRKWNKGSLTAPEFVSSALGRQIINL